MKQRFSVVRFLIYLVGFTSLPMLRLVVSPDGQGGITASLGSEAAITCLPAQTAASQLQAWLQPEGLLLDRVTLYDILHRAPYA